jgi:hypothetical protein
MTNYLNMVNMDQMTGGNPPQECRTERKDYRKLRNGSANNILKKKLKALKNAYQN